MPNPVKPIYVTKPHLAPLEELIPSLREIWQSRVLTNGGPFHERFEQALADYMGVKHVSLFANATIALVVALQALRIRGEAITTPYSFVATAHSLVWNGIAPVFVDVDRGSLNLDPSRLERAITANTTAILPVHCYGHPCDSEAIAEVAAAYDLRVIYDAAHAFGVQDAGGSILRHGDLSILSFHATKVFNTFEGGAVISGDLAMKKRVDSLKNFGFRNETTVVAPGINGKMSEFSAALGLVQLKHVDAAILRRAEVDKLYREYLAGIPQVRCHEISTAARHNFSYFPIFINHGSPETRDGLQEFLRSAGVFSRRYFYPLISDFPIYRSGPSASPENLPVAAAAAGSVLCLPIGPEIEAPTVREIVSRIGEFFSCR